ncbi:hypothetical protein MMC30_004988 [Trapelia coarctata]|nr:hypothetical protein [Trapelia coarctata]
MPKDWGQVKAQLRTYYVVDQLSVAKVQALMEEQHGFTASIRSYRSRLKDWGYRRQDERRSIVSNELAQRRATSPTLEVIAVSDKSSNEDNTAIEAETTPSPYRERLTRLTSDIHTGTSQGLSTGGSALTVLPSGLSLEPV